MTVDNMIELAGELEAYLGDPHDDASRIPFSRVLRLDEREQVPHEPLHVLRRWNVHQYCLPDYWGGRAGDVEVGFHLLRLIARRDPTTATALMVTHLAFMPAWIAATEDQGRHYVSEIQRGTRMAWALSERGHGSDVTANETRAEKVPGGYLLTGEKNLIGNATIADVVTVQARTDERGGPGGWSVFAVDKRECPAGSVAELPGERLHGLRAMDISGVRFEGVFVPEHHRIGAQGQGLEITLQSAQVARTVINGLALGAADTALRVTMDFVTRHEIFGSRVVDIPYTRRQLAECFADLLLAEAVGTGAVRALQANPAQASVFSSAVKYFVPTLLERSMAQLSTVLGARLYLREHPRFGIYQKMLRDVLAATFVDGNTVVNLKNIAVQLGGPPKDTEPDSETLERTRTVFDVDRPLPVWEPSKQTLFGRGRNDTLDTLPDGIAGLRALAARSEGRQREWFERAARAGQTLLEELRRVRREGAELRQKMGREHASSAELFRLAEQYCAINAGAAAIHLTVRSADSLPGELPDGAVLLLMVERSLRHFRAYETVTDVDVVDRVMDVAGDMHRRHRLFSHWRFPVAASDGTAGDVW
ncbi:acyl-CoA dehydrogenase [Actinopolyspora mortivallis]|uniref:acyl-CoA dehydrogenase n=1 Tax=Actinopolyspora mortivallis TaxID=33906 RepID=UPI00037438E7|nr:acyl-CoA dehydrogenase [Actinopolyspora mortivallis]